MLCLGMLAPPDCSAKGKPSLASPRLAVLDSIVTDAIHEGQIPGAVLLVWHNGQVIYRKAFGARALEPRREAMTIDTIFDIASLTKVVATTIAVMQLVEKGEVRLNDPVVKYLPQFAQDGKEDITVRMLLTHFSGLPEDLDLGELWDGRGTAFALAFAEKPIYPPGSRFLYSDVNFIILGALVERISGQSLDAYCATHIFAPLGMKHTRFLPPATWRPMIAPTQYDEDDKMLRGVVHDPTSRRMGGVAGHAGVFSTADDLSKFAQALLNGSSVLPPLAVEKMTTPQQPPTSSVLRGLGWDIDSPYSSNRGDLLPVGSFGHTGFTGTSMWIDPVTRTYIVLLTNAVHPRGGSAVALRSRVATAVAAALPLTVDEKEELRWKSITGYNEPLTAGRRLATRNGNVQTGIDVLEANGFNLLRPANGTNATGKKRIGLLTNQTGLIPRVAAPLTCLPTLKVFRSPPFSARNTASPERSIPLTLPALKTQPPAFLSTACTGLTDSARRPPADVLKQLDAVVIDIQDAGARFYTYETTLGYFLEACAKSGIEIIVLDRPNPINGSFVQGPISDPGHESFTNYYPVPIRHGMTLGELAKMFNAERSINAKLTIIPMEGWMRGDWFDSTGLAWVNPSPNLRSVTEAALYPGVAMVEGTNVSVGRGTDTPFELLGAPWIKGKDLAQYLNARNISGVRFVPVSFTPTSGSHEGEKCDGVERHSHRSQCLRRARAWRRTGLGFAQALPRGIPHGTHDRPPGKPVGVRRHQPRRRPTAHCRRLARAA